MILRRTLLGTIAAAPLVSAFPRASFAAYPDKPVRYSTTKGWPSA